MSPARERGRARRPSGIPPRPNSAAAPAGARRATARSHALALSPALVAGALLYAPVLRLFFAQDDVTFLSRAAGLEPTPWSFARPLSEGLAWRALYAWFGLWPAPYHAVRLALHLASAALVYVIGLRVLRGRAAAGAAAFLFATSSLGFTVLHWASCIVEASAAALALGAFALHLDALARGSARRAWAAAALAVAAALAKESALGLPLVFALAAFATLPPRAAWRASLPSGVLFAALGVAFLATRALLPYGQYAGGGYQLAFAPAALLGQLFAYVRWCLLLAVPVREASLATGTRLVLPALLALAAAAFAVWAERAAPRRPATIGAAWFAVLLLPVLPLAHHAYAYYLYVPWAGACWLVAGAFERLASRWPRPAAAAVAVAALAVTGALEWANVRVREAALLGPVPADRTMRESLLLGNAVAGLRAAGLAPGQAVGFVNPYPREHGSLVPGGAPVAGAMRSYIPLEGAMREGQSLRLFAPGTRYLGFATLPPPEWDRARLFLFDNDGTLTPLGSGAAAYRSLARFCAEADLGAVADSLRRRAAALDAAAAVSRPAAAP